MITYRKATSADLTHLRDLDLKCHEQEPADQKWWAAIAENPQSGCVVGCKSQVPISMIVFEKQVFRLPDFQQKEATLHIHKLCVRKEFRKQKSGQKLLAHAHEEAKKRSCPYMSMSVPEYRCKPETDPENDVSAWLNKLGFKATIILPTKVNLYGQEFDQYLFVYKV